MRVDEHRTELGGMPVFYRAGPRPGTPPLYLHGVPTSSDDWIPFLERTGGLAPDLIGFGRTGKAGNLDYSLEGVAQFLERFLDEIGVTRVKLVGHDWGAGVAMVFARRHPERVERLVLFNALPVLPGFRWPRLERLWRRPLVGELTMGFTNRWMLGRVLRKGSVNAEAWPPARIAQVWQQFDQGTQRAILRLHRSVQGSESEVPRLDLPALVVWGEHDPWLPLELGEAYAGRLNTAAFERVANAGHWPWLDQPRVIDRVASFVEQA